MRTSFIVILVVCLSFSALSAQRGAIPPPLIREGVTEKISEHVYVIPDGDALLVPNIGIIVGSRGTLVVDSGLGSRNARHARRCERCGIRRGTMNLGGLNAAPTPV